MCSQFFGRFLEKNVTTYIRRDNAKCMALESQEIFRHIRTSIPETVSFM